MSIPADENKNVQVPTEPDMETTREVHGFQCMFCGIIYTSKEEAERCWTRHVQFQIEPLFSMQDEFPFEVLVKKQEGMMFTEIATYVLEKKEKVKIRVPTQEVEQDE